MRIGCKAFAKNLLKRCGCTEDCYRGVEIKDIESDIIQCFKDNPLYNENNYPIHDIAVCLRNIGDAVPIPPPPQYCMVFDTENCTDGITFDNIDSAKMDAIETLLLWMTDCCIEYNMDADISKWTDKQVEEWDMMYYNCSVAVYKYNPQTKMHDIEVWSPSQEDEKNIGWLPYEDLIK